MKKPSKKNLYWVEVSVFVVLISFSLSYYFGIFDFHKKPQADGDMGHGEYTKVLEEEFNLIDHKIACEKTQIIHKDKSWDSRMLEAKVQGLSKYIFEIGFHKPSPEGKIQFQVFFWNNFPEENQAINFRGEDSLSYLGSLKNKEILKGGKLQKYNYELDDQQLNNWRNTSPSMVVIGQDSINLPNRFLSKLEELMGCLEEIHAFQKVELCSDHFEKYDLEPPFQRMEGKLIELGRSHHNNFQLQLKWEKDNLSIQLWTDGDSLVKGYRVTFYTSNQIALHTKIKKPLFEGKYKKSYVLRLYDQDAWKNAEIRAIKVQQANGMYPIPLRGEAIKLLNKQLKCISKEMEQAVPFY